MLEVTSGPIATNESKNPLDFSWGIRTLGIQATSSQSAQLFESPRSSQAQYDAVAQVSEHPLPSKEDLLEVLRRGEIPQIIHEELRMIPLDSSVGKDFNTAMITHLKELYSNWDFSANPVRFFLMDKDAPEAVVLAESTPLLVGFSREFFDRTRTASPHSIDERLAVLAHEINHSLIRRKFRLKENTKAEEGGADICAVRDLHASGRDPRAYLELIKRWQERETKKLTFSEKVQRVIDPHPLNSTRISYIEAEITKIERRDGPIQICPKLIQEDDHLSKLASSGRAIHQAFMAGFLKSVSFNKRSTVERIEALCDFVDKCEGNWNEARVRDVMRVFRRIGCSGQIKGDETLAAINTLAEKILKIPDAELFIALYNALCKGLLRSESLRPLGRLGLISEASKDFTSAKTSESAYAAAKRFLDILESEPLIQSEEGRTFLKKLKIFHFEYPKSVGQIVSWERHIEYLSELDPNRSTIIVRALLLLGIDDQRIFKFGDTKLLRDYVSAIVARKIYTKEDGYTEAEKSLCYFPEMNGFTLFPLESPAFARGLGVADSFRRVHHLRIGARGVVEEIPQSYQDIWKVRSAHERAVFTHEFAAKVVEGISDELDEKNAGEIVEKVAFLRLSGEPTTEIVAPELLRRSPQHFRELNSLQINRNMQSQETIVETFKLWLKSEDPKAHDRIRHFFGLEGDENRLFRFVDDEYEWSHRHAERLPGLVKFSESPLLKFFMSEAFKIFTPEDRFTLLTKSCFSPAHGFLEKDLLLPLTKLAIDSVGDVEDTSLLTWGALCSFLTKVEGKFGKLRYAAYDHHDHTFMGIADTPFRAFLLALGRSHVEIYPNDRPSLENIVMYRRALGKGEAFFLGPENTLLERHFTESITAGVKWSQNPLKALAQWRNISWFFKPGEAYKELRKIVDLGDKLPENGSKVTFYEKVLKSRNGARISDPELRSYIIGHWSDAIEVVLGKDDGSAEYSQNMLKIISRARKHIPRIDQIEAFNTLGNKVLAQEDLALGLERSTLKVKEKDFQLVHLVGMGVEMILWELEEDDEKKRALVDFLTVPPSESASRAFFHEIGGQFKELFDESLDNEISTKGSIYQDLHEKHQRRKEMLGLAEALYKNFWNSPLEVRALIVRELLLPAGKASDSKHESGTDYILTKLFPEGEKYSEEGRLFARAYLSECPDHQRAILLSAFLVAIERSHGSKLSIGKILSIVAEALGPAEVKAAQAASSHPDTPDAITCDMQRLKTKASPLTRWELMHLIRRNVPEVVRNAISHVGEILGSASFFVSVEVTLQDGTSQVLQLLRASVKERAEAGIQILSGMARELALKNPAYEILYDFIFEASKSWRDEIDPELGRLKLDKAKELYQGVTVAVDQRKVRVNVPSLYRLDGFGPAYGPGYRILSKITGRHLLEFAVDDLESKLFSKAILTLEFCNIFSGAGFDDDRHGGNCKCEDDQLGLFDFGGLGLSHASKEDLEMLGALLLDVLREENNLKNISSVFLQALRSMKSAGKPCVSYLMRVEKALISLGDCIKRVTADDTIDALIAGLKNAHPALKEYFMKHQIMSILASQFDSWGVSSSRLFSSSIQVHGREG